MRNLHAPTVIEQVIAAMGLDQIEGGRAIIEQGWPQIQSELLRVGLDAETARTRQRSLAEAAVDFDNFPYLAQLHTRSTMYWYLRCHPHSCAGQNAS